MHIYFFGVYNAQGGMENYALNLIRGIKQKYNDVDFTLLVFKEVFSGKDIYLNENLCDYIVLPDYKKHPIAFMKKFKEIGEKVNPSDIIQLNVCTFRNFLLFGAVSNIACRKIIVSHYSKNDDGFAVLHYIDRMIFHKKYENIAVSDAAGKFLFKNDYTVITNGVISDNFTFDQEARNRIRKRYNIEDSTFLIGHVGRITKEKNQYFSIKVLKAILELHEDVKLMLVGKYYDDKIAKYIQENGLSDKVILTGPIYDEIGQYYSAFDCSILPSKNEAMGIALIEALCNGLPVLYSKNVPALNLENSNLKKATLIQLDLDAQLWAKHMIDLLNSSHDNRINYIKGTEYEISTFIDNYYAIYSGKN